MDIYDKLAEDATDAYEALNGADGARVFGTAKDVRYAVNRVKKIILEENKARLKEEIEKSLNNELGRYESILLTNHTPEILQAVGMEDKPILFTQKHLRDGLHPKGKNPKWHGLKIEDYLNLEENMSDPAFIIDSFSDDDSVLVVTSNVDSDENPIMACLRVDGEGQYKMTAIGSNYLTSVYGKDNFIAFIEKNIEADFVLYAGKEKIQELERFAGLQLRGNYSNRLEFDRIIHKSINVVNADTLYDSQMYSAADNLSVQLSKNAAERPMYHIGRVLRKIHDSDFRAITNKALRESIRFEEFKNGADTEISSNGDIYVVTGYYDTETDAMKAMESMSSTVRRTDDKDGTLLVEQVYLQSLGYDEDGDYIAGETLMSTPKPIEYDEDGRTLRIDKDGSDIKLIFESNQNKDEERLYTYNLGSRINAFPDFAKAEFTKDADGEVFGRFTADDFNSDSICEITFKRLTSVYAEYITNDVDANLDDQMRLSLKEWLKVGFHAKDSIRKSFPDYNGFIKENVVPIVQKREVEELHQVKPAADNERLIVISDNLKSKEKYKAAIHMNSSHMEVDNLMKIAARMKPDRIILDGVMPENPDAVSQLGYCGIKVDIAEKTHTENAAYSAAAFNAGRKMSRTYDEEIEF